MKKLAVVGVGLLVAVGFSACGGDDKNATLTKSELVAKADPICKEANARNLALAKELQEKAKDNLDPTAAFKELAPKYEAAQKKNVEAVKKLKELKPPQGIAARYKKFVSLVDQQAAVTKKLQKAAADEKDTTQLQKQYADGYLKLQTAQSALKRDGFKHCSGVAESADASDGSVTEPVESNFVATADRICAKATAQGRALAKDLSDSLTKVAQNSSDPESVKKALQDAASKLEAGINENKAALKELAALKPPPEMASDYRAFLSAQQSFFSLREKVLAIFKSGDIEKVADIGKVIDPAEVQKLQNAAAKLSTHGFKECSAAQG